jgi:hypothetical protein
MAQHNGSRNTFTAIQLHLPRLIPAGINEEGPKRKPPNSPKCFPWEQRTQRRVLPIFRFAKNSISPPLQHCFAPDVTVKGILQAVHKAVSAVEGLMPDGNGPKEDED